MSKKEAYKKFVESLPKKRMGAGAIIRNIKNEILMLTPSYKPVLEIPGGVVEKNESPYEACKREVQEELGLDLALNRMLCVDYNPTDDHRTESLMFIFCGGILDEETIKSINLDGKEIVGCQFLPLEEIQGKTTDSLYRRIKKCLAAIESEASYYLENQSFIKEQRGVE